jgi:hypothetical protein
MIQTDLGDQTLEPRPQHRRRPGLPQVLIDHHDPHRRPTQHRGSIHQGILQPGRLLMIKNLLFRRLPNVDHCESVQVPGRHLGPSHPFPRQQESVRRPGRRRGPW